MLLGEPVNDWIRVKRNEGQSWRTIARDLRDATDIDVAHETLRSWIEKAAA